ncbi:hypothetical protein [Paratissierella segnis]|uniref:Uncharacterized protein n=1 Tax=Paratissierella segnis TaxID=2763679 RepID=A0A926EU26_9FIRM|nr:hypothetical protein [Paratissierella segnis]MBC8587507.1 hypothetical protein [Paratissierella segnis]
MFAYIDTASFRVDNKTAYFTTDKTILRDKNDVILTTGKDLTAKLAIGDQVDVKATGIDANEVKIVKKASEFALADAIKAANKALTDHVAAGGKATNTEYKAVEAALKADPQVAANITSTTTALTALTNDIKAAKEAQVAYLAAGGNNTDAVYKAVDTALAADPQVKANITSATSALEAATDTASAQAIVDAELAKVPATLVLAGSTAAAQADIKIAVEGLIDNNKVTVGVSASSPWVVTLTLRADGTTTANKTITVTNEATVAEKAAVDAELAKVVDLTLAAGSAANQAAVDAAVEGLVDLNKVVVTSVTQGSGNEFAVVLTAKGGTYNDNKTITVSSADVNAAKAALTNASLAMVSATTDPVVVNAPAAASGISYFITDATDTNVTTTGAGASATSVSIARDTSAGSTVLELTITKGLISETATFTVTVPTGTDAATIAKN